MTRDTLDWIAHPVKSFHELREEKKQIRNQEIGSFPLENYQIDKFFSPIFLRFLTVPEGYVGVRRRMGKIGERLNYIENPRGYEIDYTEATDGSLTDPRRILTKSRDFPWGGVVEPGLHTLIGLAGFWESMAVVPYEIPITREIKKSNLLSGDGMEIPDISSVAIYRVIDPVRAANILASKDTYHRVVGEIAEARVAGEVGERPILDLIRDEKTRNLMINQDNKRMEYDELRRVGVQLDSLRITKIDIPDDQRKVLNEYVTATTRAKGIEAEAIAHAKAGSILDRIPGAKESLRAATSRTQGSGFINIPGLTEVAEAIASAFKKP